MTTQEVADRYNELTQSGKWQELRGRPGLEPVGIVQQQAGGGEEDQGQEGEGRQPAVPQAGLAIDLSPEGGRGAGLDVVTGHEGSALDRWERPFVICE